MVEIVSYDPTWPRRFDAEADRIRLALPGLSGDIEHIGSTAVPGLSSRDQIDVAFALASLVDEAAYRPALERIGYILQSERQLLRIFTSIHSGRSNFNLYVCNVESDWLQRLLTFRDFLRAESHVASIYQRRKESLALAAEDVDEYNRAKVEFIADIESMAGRQGSSVVPDMCSFCGEPRSDKRTLVAGRKGIFICEECVELCRRVLAEDQRGQAS